MLRTLLIAALTCAACAAPAPAQEANVLNGSYPEGALWQGERLYFAEMGADRISTYERGTRGVFFSQQGCGPTAIAPYGEGFLVLCHIDRAVAVDANGANCGGGTATRRACVCAIRTTRRRMTVAASISPIPACFPGRPGRMAR
ncbi:MAG: hypothetical protein R3C16_00310 [Hyphomonadaceae bacterium]